MANEPKQPEPKRQPVVVTPEELVALIDRDYEKQWNKDRGAFRDPVLIVRILLFHAKTAALRLVEAYRHIAALNDRATALEAFRIALEAQAAEVERQIMAAAEAEKAAPAPAPPAGVTPIGAAKKPKEEAK